MSTVYQPSPSRPGAPLIHANSQPIPPSAAVVSAKAVDDLLQSGPNNAREPMRPDAPKLTLEKRATMERALNDLSNQLDRKMVEHMMRAPKSNASKAIHDELDTLTTPHHLKSLLSGPNAASCTKDFAKIEAQLKKESIGAVLDPISDEQVEAYRSYVGSALFDLKANLMNSSVGSRFELVRAFARKQHPQLTSIQDYINELNTKSKHLCDIATQVNKAIGALQYAHHDDWEPRNLPEPDHDKYSKTFSFTNTAQSTLEHPCEIRNFVTDRDKIDVTEIRQQLNKPLQCVNQLSGASGEIQLKYSRANNASVLVISGDRGEPALVAKVFGEVKEKDLLT